MGPGRWGPFWGLSPQPLHRWASLAPSCPCRTLCPARAPGRTRSPGERAGSTRLLGHRVLGIPSRFSHGRSVGSRALTVAPWWRYGPQRSDWSVAWLRRCGSNHLLRRWAMSVRPLGPWGPPGLPPPGALAHGSSPLAPPSLAGKWGRSLAQARPEGPDGGGFRCSPCGQGLLPYPVRSMLMFHVKHIPGGSKSRRDRFCPPLTLVPSPGSYARLASNDRWPGAIKAPGKGAHLPHGPTGGLP